jgi:peptide/nickel transport system permease protein
VGLAEVSTTTAVRAPNSPLRSFWRRFSRSRTGLVGLIIVSLFIIAAALAPVIARQDPIKQNIRFKLQAPSAAHLLGTDELGRDILARLVFGSRISLMIGVVSVLIGLAAGVAIGLLAGYFGGWLDRTLMACIDIMLAFPGVLLAIGMAAALGPSLFNAMLAIGIWSVPTFARLARGSALQVKELDYVTAAQSLGARTFRIMARHILPNSLASIIVYSTLLSGTAILTSAALSFLGLGVQPPTPEWGAMVSAGRAYLREAPHVITFPGLAIFLTVLGFNLLGDALQDALDPRLKGS